ncbi:hypothetical protein TNCV_1863791 [Trichonephila clavipes]|nr:hypothetical protein TNCV_1863791 [Trichonephila clavipes]
MVYVSLGNDEIRAFIKSLKEINSRKSVSLMSFPCCKSAIFSCMCELYVELAPSGAPPHRAFPCLSPPHAYTMGVKYMTGWVSTSGTVGSNLKSETQTGAKILWI